MSEPVKLHPGDPRARALQDAILDVIYERALGLPVVLVLGVLRLVEHNVIDEQWPNVPNR